MLAGKRPAKARWATIRPQLILVSARIANTAGRQLLHLPKGWRHAAAWQKLYDAATPTTTGHHLIAIAEIASPRRAIRVEGAVFSPNKGYRQEDTAGLYTEVAGLDFCGWLHAAATIPIARRGRRCARLGRASNGENRLLQPVTKQPQLAIQRVPVIEWRDTVVSAQSAPTSVPGETAGWISQPDGTRIAAPAAGTVTWMALPLAGRTTVSRSIMVGSLL